MTRFGLDGGQYITIIPNRGTQTHLPVDEPAPLLGVLASCVELQDVAPRDDIATLARYTDNPEQKAALEALTGDDDTARQRYRDAVFDPNRSLLDLLEAYPACSIPFAEYLDMLPPLRPRYYSISSSPLASPGACSITVGVLHGAARSGDGTFTGVGSGYLASLPERATVFTFLRPPSIAFRPPENPHTPMIMIGAGTGLAPFRGFLQERAALQGRGSRSGRRYCSSAAATGRSTFSTATNARLRAARPGARGECVLPGNRHSLPLRAGGDAGQRGPDLGAAAKGRGRVCVRQRVDHRAGGPSVAHPHLRRQDRHRGRRHQRVVVRAALRGPLRRGHLGRVPFPVHTSAARRPSPIAAASRPSEAAESGVGLLLLPLIPPGAGHRAQAAGGAGGDRRPVVRAGPAQQPRLAVRAGVGWRPCGHEGTLALTSRPRTFRSIITAIAIRLLSGSAGLLLNLTADGAIIDWDEDVAPGRSPWTSRTPFGAALTSRTALRCRVYPGMAPEIVVVELAARFRRARNHTKPPGESEPSKYSTA